MHTGRDSDVRTTRIEPNPECRYTLNLAESGGRGSVASQEIGEEESVFEMLIETNVSGDSL